MPRKKRGNASNTQGRGLKKPKNQTPFPVYILEMLFNFMTTSEERMNLLLASKFTMLEIFSHSSIMRNIRTTITINDALRRNFITDYGQYLRNVSVNINDDDYAFLEFLLANIPNVEVLSINISNEDPQILENFQPAPINLPNLRILEVFKPVDLKIIMSLIRTSNTIKVKYMEETCDLRAIAEYLTVTDFECSHPVVPYFSFPALTLASLTTVKFGYVHCGSIRNLIMPYIQSIEINMLARADDFLRGFFDSIRNVQHIKINAVTDRDDIVDILGEIVRLPALKTFELRHVGIFYININVEARQVELSAYIRDNCEKIVRAIAFGYEWYRDEV